MVGADEHRRQGDDTDGEGRQPEADDRHRGATANERDERRDDGDRTERGAGGIGELRVLGNLQAVDPADAPQPRRSPGRHRTEVDENGQRGRQPAALHEGEQADSELGDSDGHEQPGERGVVGVEAGDAGVDRPGPDRGEAGELHDAHGNRHRPFVGGGGGGGRGSTTTSSSDTTVSSLIRSSSSARPPTVRRVGSHVLVIGASRVPARVGRGERI